MSQANPEPMGGDHLSRRAFTRAIAGPRPGAFAAPGDSAGRNLNEKLNIAIIGVGGRGGSQPRERRVREHRRPLRRERAGRRTGPPRSIPRHGSSAISARLFDHAKEFDAVVVSTTEHTHAFATLPALQLGKHVYCEKPLTHNVWEARIIREAAAKAKVATQMGTQIHAGDNYRRVVELSRPGPSARSAKPMSGSAGPGAGNRPRTRSGTKTSCRSTERPSESIAAPERPRLGPLARPRAGRPFNEVYFPGPKWYRWWDFGNGTMSDLGSHWNDLPFWALKLQVAPHHRGVRPAAASGDRSRLDARDLRIRRARRACPP